MIRPGRPSSNQKRIPVCVQMPAEMVRQIDELAIEEMHSRTTQIVAMLRQALDRTTSASTEQTNPQGKK